VRERRKEGRKERKRKKEKDRKRTKVRTNKRKKDRQIGREKEGTNKRKTDRQKEMFRSVKETLQLIFMPVITYIRPFGSQLIEALLSIQCFTIITTTPQLLVGQLSFDKLPSPQYNCSQIFISLYIFGAKNPYRAIIFFSPNWFECRVQPMAFYIHRHFVT
jgi:hypothetical protein